MERRRIAIRGIVQGVGFRPFVHGLAARHGLGGFVRNETGGVSIEIEGETGAVEAFLRSLEASPPPLARIDELSWRPSTPRGDARFTIEPSEIAASDRIVLAPDAATCADCLAELFDPADRRYRYPFLNCTNCGPRFTIVTGAPYDRERTTMASFVMCAECLREYQDPRDRRFHAEPIACPACGPRLVILDARGNVVETSDPLAEAIAALHDGWIVALKGVGGYHLACAAGDEAAVATLRARKHREERPFAVMTADVEAARRLVAISPDEETLLTSRGRPIVLMRRRAETRVAHSVAPGNPRLGVMLPYTPLHYLLARAMNGEPLVMTSGNRSDEPIAYDDLDAIKRLSGIADRFLTHDRPIHMRCDDSVTRVTAGAEAPIRRSRGSAPRPLPLPIACPRPILAVGAHQKATFALGRRREALISHHIGDLDHYEAYRSFTLAVAHHERLFACTPELIVHDMHPDYASTRYALERSGEIPLMAVQHHHAHVASCMAEHGLAEPVIGVAFDGSGYGLDGTIWGGEFLVGDYRGFCRRAHFRPVALPGGEQAIREPWRIAAAHLLDAGLDFELLRARVSEQALAALTRQIERRLNAPLASSVGRLFDAVAALAGVRDRVAYEGQAAVELEWAAENEMASEPYPFALSGDPIVVDTRPIIAAVAADAGLNRGARVIGRRFHATMAEVVAQVCARLADATGLEKVVLSGGVFLNALLARDVLSRLDRGGFQVFRHRLVPPSDAGLCLGQLAIAAAAGESRRINR